MNNHTSLERRIDQLANTLLAKLSGAGVPKFGVEFLVFGLKQAWACLFGAILLALIMMSALLWPINASFARYDALFLAALLLQAAMLGFRLEKPQEAVVILVFHIVGTGMEVFKTAAGSWTYPEESLFRIGAVPLFSGFMYAAVGSYIARATRLFDLRYSHYPPHLATIALAVGIYINFFTHHYIVDFRWLLFLCTVALFWRCKVHARIYKTQLVLPMLFGFFLVSIFIWLAENIATMSRIWLYPQQAGAWVMVSPAKLGSWYLLMIISFVLVNVIHRPKVPKPIP